MQYSFKTGKETGTIFDVNTARDCSIKSFDDYIMSPDEKLILIQTDTKPIYRRSFTANYYIFNVKTIKWNRSQKTAHNRFLYSHRMAIR